MDKKLFIFINQFAGRNDFLDAAAIILAKYMPYVFIFILLYLWFRKRKGGKSKNIALYAGYAAVLGILFNFFIALFYFHPRPFMDKLGILLINHAPESSFPSDHTTFMMAIAFMFLYFKQTRRIGILSLILGAIGGLARIYCGLHFPFDIIGSIIVAAIASGIIFLLGKRLQKINSLIIAAYHKITKWEK